MFTYRFRDANQRNGWQSPPTWGREDIEAAWLRQAPDARAFMAAHLNYVARHLSTDRTLAILLEPGAPRLGELHNEKYVLGYVGYFFDCWNKFREYEQVLPATMEPAATGNLGLRQVALLHIYEGKPAIKRDERANELARQHGHASGAKLYDHYRKLSKQTGITGVEGAEVPKLILDIEAVLPLLSGAPEQAARAHLQTLKTK